MKKRVIAFVIFVVCMVRLIPISAIATEVINNYSDDKNARIEELFDRRNELVKHSEENKDLISEIDEQLKALGVVFLNDQSQLHGVQSAGDLRSNSDGITWTRTTFNHVYAGAVFEVELIRGTPANENSTLFRSIGYNGSASSVQANVGIALKIVGEAVLTNGLSLALGEWAPLLDVGLTLWDIHQGVAEAMQETTSVSMPEYQDMIVTESQIKLAYVRPLGEDSDYHMLCYYGTEVKYTAMTQRWLRYTVNGTVYSDTYQDQFSGVISSPNYEMPAALAAKNCYYYERNGTDFDPYYYTRRIKISICGQIRTLGLPYCYYNG